jgi:radical SAM superfamily enzyme
MQGRITNLRDTLKTLQKSYDDSLNQSQTAEILLNTKLPVSESLIRDQLENNMKQRLISLDLRRQKLVEQSLNLLQRVQEMKIATNEWKSNLTNLSIKESGLTLESSNILRERVTKISQDVKKLENDMKLFVNQMYKLQDVSKNFDREMKSLQLSVEDASRVSSSYFPHPIFR